MATGFRWTCSRPARTRSVLTPVAHTRISWTDVHGGTMRRWLLNARGFLILAALVTVVALAARRPRAERSIPLVSERPGVEGSGVTLLPNGWRIAPAGRSLQVGDLPLSMVATPDHRYLVISNNGWSAPSLTIVDTEQMFVKARVPIEHAWLGLAWNPQGTRLYSSGAADNTVTAFTYIH